MNAQRSEGTPESMDADTLIGLVQLQRIDEEIAALDRGGARRPGERKAAEGEVGKAEAALADARDLVKATQKRIDAEILASEALKTEVAKFEGQLYSLKSNDEFEKMKAQIRARQEQEGRLQDKILELMMALDDLKARLPDRQKEVDVARERSADIDRRAAAEGSSAEQKVAELRQRREVVAANVSGDMLARYESIRARRDGVAIAPVDPDGEVCRGCYTQVTMQILNQVMAQRYVTCPHCDRILYLSQNLPR